MWKTVPIREQSFRSSGSSSSRRQRRETHQPLASEVNSAPQVGSVVRDNEVNAVIKRVRRVSAALRREQWVVEMMTHLEQATVNAALFGFSSSAATDVTSNATSVQSSPLVTVNIVALGIGSVVDDEQSVCASSLLQLGLLHCLFDEQMCARIDKTLQHAAKRQRHRITHPSTSTTTTVADTVKNEEAMRHAEGLQRTEPLTASSPPPPAAAVRLCVEYFDPVLTEMDKAVCAKLGYAVSNTNCFGAYAVPNSSSPNVTVAYMPHASATLYHNLFAANWPRNEVSADPVRQASNSSDDSPQVEPSSSIFMASPLHRLVVIGNNLKDYEVRRKGAASSLHSFTRLMPVLHMQVLFRADSRSRKLDRGIEGMSFTDVERAFSDLCLTSTASSKCLLSLPSLDEVTAAPHLMSCFHQLSMEKAPKIIRDGADTL